MSGRNAEFAAQALPGMEEHPMRVAELSRVRNKPMAMRSPEEMLQLAKYQSPLMFGESAEKKGYVVSHAMGAKKITKDTSVSVEHNTPHLPEMGKGYEDVHDWGDGDKEVTPLGIHVGSLGAAVDRNGAGATGRRSAFLHFGEVQGDYQRADDHGEDWGDIPEKAEHYVNEYEDPGSISILAPRRLNDVQKAQGAAGVRFYQDEVHSAVKHGQPVNAKAAEMARTGAPLHHEIVPDDEGDIYSDQYDRRARVRPSAVNAKAAEMARTGAPLHHEIVPDDEGDIYSDQYDRRARVRPSAVEPEPHKPGVAAVRDRSQQLAAFAVDQDKFSGHDHFYNPNNISESYDDHDAMGHQKYHKPGLFASPQFDEKPEFVSIPQGKKVPVPAAV